MKPLFLCMVMFVFLQNAGAQSTVSHDLLSFSPPANWTFADKGVFLSYSNTNPAAHTFCLISVYGSTAASGSPDSNFIAAWNSDVAAHFTVTKNPVPEFKETSSGVDYVQGAADVSSGTQHFFIRLLAFTMQKKAQAILLMSINENGLIQYQTAIDHFLASLQYNTAAGVSTNSAMVSSFDDGWTATTTADYILVTKNPYTVHVYYAVPYSDESRADPVEYFYTHQLSNDIMITHVTARSTPSQYQYFIEGDAVEKSTGKNCYVTMNVVSKNGTAITVVAISPNEQLHHAQFGTDLKNMTGYNRFGVTLQAIAGTWGAASGSSLNYYDYTTGNYAGTNAVVMSNKITFNNRDGFEATFKGASGMVGAMKTYQENTKGTFTIRSPWQIATTSQDHTTTVYDCWMEGVKGGMILHMVNHQFTGNAFDFIKQN